MESTKIIAPKRATLDDLMGIEGKAELIGGRIVRSMTGDQPSDVASEIFVSLRAYAKARSIGRARTDGVGYAVPELSSGRESFSPDASYYLGPRPANRMRFIKGAPTFAVDVRSEGDHGSAAERTMAATRADYFEAGTLVVWDVDPIASIVRSYRAVAPDHLTVFDPQDTADAEPAVPGWRIDLADVFA